ncbi:thioredoxin family protein [Nonomuraea sp. MTCD27]
MAKMDELTDATFSNTVLKASGPVLVVFRAEWSAVCRALDPILE